MDPIDEVVKMLPIIARLATVALLVLATPTRALSPTQLDAHTGKPRLIVLSDMGNEPDDQMSLVRLLLYSNELEIEGLVATTSTWLRTSTNPQTMHAIIAAYGTVRPNLIENAPGWPTRAALDAAVSVGQPAYGMAAVGADKSSAGAAAIIRAVDRPDPRPVWISVWGGANTLAQALSEVRATRAPAALAAFIAKLRVYSISDQDDAGPWIRREFPDLFYIVAPSRPDSENYGSATWTGISGDVFYRNGAGADGSTVTNDWLDRHIRQGPLGAHYPKFAFIMEGDTPAFLGFTDNGLASVRNPSWGGWGGRYVWRQPYGEAHPIWTQGGDAFPRITSADTVTGIDGRQHTSDQATIWRWRSAFQNDFAARMSWTQLPRARANHPPIAVVNRQDGTAPILIDAHVGRPLTLDAAGSLDHDAGQRLRYRWYHYAEAGFVPGQGMAGVSIAGADTSRATVTPTEVCRPQWLPVQTPCPTGVAHIILEVTDDGSPALTSYRRIILTVRPAGG
jgi:hypothetical protein